MAKLQIIANNTKLKDSASVNASALAISPSYATNLGSGISSIGKAIEGIQADLHKIEDTNQYNEIMPKITADMSTAYNKYKNSSDVVNVPGLFEKDVDISKWKKDLSGYNENVKRLVQQGVVENKIKLLPKLINNLTNNAIYKYKDGIGKQFNTAMLDIVSGDNDLIGIGANKFAELKNNKALEEFFGAEEWNKITEAKELQLAELMIDSNISLNPTKVVQNRDLLVAAVGTDKADYYTDKAKNTLNAKMKDLDASKTWEEIKENNTKIEIFTDLLLRVNAFKKDPTLKNEAPTAAMLFDAYNDQMINKSMLNMLTNALIDGDAQTDSEITGAITSAFYSAGSIEMLEDIKRAVFLDENILRKIGLQDMTDLTKIVERAKKNFPAHKETKKYEDMIKNNIITFNASSSSTTKKKSSLDTLKGNILNEYHEFIDQGYSAQNAYLKVLNSSSFLENLVPKLTVISKPEWMKGWDLAALYEKSGKESVAMFDGLNNSAVLYLKGFEKDGKTIAGHKNYEKFYQELAQIDFLEKVFQTRFNLFDGTPEEKLAYALEGKAKNLIDEIYGKNKEGK
jgi:hypothetical protein